MNFFCFLFFAYRYEMLVLKHFFIAGHLSDFFCCCYEDIASVLHGTAVLTEMYQEDSYACL